MNADSPPTFAAVRDRVEDARSRINNLIRTVGRFFVGKGEVLEMMAVCTIAQEPLLLVGPPGTAKSDLVVKFCQAMNLAEGDYFEYMLTKFTEPSEIVGPIDIGELKEGRYIRRIGGKLPTAKIVFLDEIFKSNSAILNTLLTILNERKFYQDGRPEPVAMVMLFAATNTIPEFSEMDALRDRFVFKVESRTVKEEQFAPLVEKGVMNEMYQNFGQRPWETDCRLEDFLTVKMYLDYLLSGFATGESGDLALQRDRARYFPAPIFDLFRRMLLALESEGLVRVSDRKVVKLYRLLRTRAFLLHGGEVRVEDLRMLRYLGERETQFALVREKVEQMLRVG